VYWYMRLQQESKLLGRKRTNENGKQACVTPPQRKKLEKYHIQKKFAFYSRVPK